MFTFDKQDDPKKHINVLKDFLDYKDRFSFKASNETGIVNG